MLLIGIDQRVMKTGKAEEEYRPNKFNKSVVGSHFLLRYSTGTVLEYGVHTLCIDLYFIERVSIMTVILLKKKLLERLEFGFAKKTIFKIHKKFFSDFEFSPIGNS